MFLELDGEELQEIKLLVSNGFITIDVVRIFNYYLYEVLYNFTVLNAQIAAGVVDGMVPDIDRLAVADPDRPWNLVFATKVFLAAFIISTHAFYLSIKKEFR